MALTFNERAALRRLIDAAARARTLRGFDIDFDPESLTSKAIEADAANRPKVAEELRSFRDEVVNVLLGEGWTLTMVESAVKRSWKNDGRVTRRSTR